MSRDEWVDDDDDDDDDEKESSPSEDSNSSSSRRAIDTQPARSATLWIDERRRDGLSGDIRSCRPVCPNRVL